jgi:hypothetical protein
VGGTKARKNKALMGESGVKVSTFGVRVSCMGILANFR